MAHFDFNTIILNVADDQIESRTSVMIDGTVHIRVKLIPAVSSCPYCGGPVKLKDYSSHSFNHLPAFGYPTVIDWTRRRYLCKHCGRSFSEPNPFGPEHFHQTYAVLNSIAKSLSNIHLSFKDIAQANRVSVSTVQLYADSFLVVPRNTLPVSLGIDELHSQMAKYGGPYLAVLVDNVNRSLCDVLPNRSKRTLSRYFEQIPAEERKRVRYVTIDLWQPYKDVALKYFPNCCVAADPFHVIKHLTDAFTRLRVDIMNQCVYGSPEYYLLKKWHRLLETDCDLDNKPKYNSFFKRKLNYRDLYNMILSLNPNLSLAYHLKEMYRDFNRSGSFENAPAQLDQLIEAFETADLDCYKDFVSLLNNWMPEIINSFQRPFDNRKQSNALTEHINSRLRDLITVSNGFSNFERFRARAIYCLNRHVFYTLTSSLNSKKREGKTRGSYNKQKDSVLDDDPNNSIDTMTDDSDD